MFDFLKHKPNASAHKSLTYTVKLKLDGMHCVACSVTIDDTLEELPGIRKSETKYAESVATITYEPTVTNIAAIQAAITSLGYSSTVFDSQT